MLMNKTKLVALFLTLALSLGTMGCSNVTDKEPLQDTDVTTADLNTSFDDEDDSVVTPDEDDLHGMTLFENCPRDSYYLFAAMYGYEIGDGRAITYFDYNNDSYSTVMYAGSDSEFYAVFGIQSDHKDAGDFDGYLTYHFKAENGRIISSEMISGYDRKYIIAHGDAYSGDIMGKYKTKAYVKGHGLVSYSFDIDGESISLFAYQDGTDVGGRYTGKYSYDMNGGTLTAQLRADTASSENDALLKVSGKLYEKDHTVYFICEYSDISMIAVDEEDFPLTFKLPKKDIRDIEVLENFAAKMINYADEKMLFDGDVSYDTVSSFILSTSIWSYRENRYPYAELWNSVDWRFYLSEEDAKRIAYEVFGVEFETNGYAVPVTGFNFGRGFSAHNMEYKIEGDVVRVTCDVRGDGMNLPMGLDFGSASFTMRYITEGDRTFLRLEDITTSGMDRAFFRSTVSAYDCKENYFTPDTSTYGEYTLTLPIDKDKFDVDFDVRYCGDNCNDLSNMVSVITQGYAPVYTPVLCGEKIGYYKNAVGYKTYRFKWEIPEITRAALEKQGVLGEIEQGLASQYMYLLDMGGGYFAYIGIYQKEKGEVISFEDVDMIIRNMYIEHN